MKSELGLAAEAAATVMNIANTHLAAGQHEAAVKSYDDALSRLATATDSRQEELILYNRAIALHALGRFDDALRDYGRVVSSLSTAAAPTPQRLYPALVGRGSTRLARGDAAMAETDYEAALRIEPATAVAYDRAELRFGLAQAVSARDAARARGLAAEALELARASGDASLIASIEGWQRAALGDSSPAVAKGGVAVASSSD